MLAGMTIGVPKEIKDHETRVGLVPSGVTALREAGHGVLVETHAGEGSSLTDREYMVLIHLPTRQSNAEIGERLDVSLNTVKTHLKHIYRKLDVVGRSQAVEAAERLHLL